MTLDPRVLQEAARASRPAWPGVVAAVLLVLVGCQNGGRRKDPPPEAPPPERSVTTDPLMAGTIGAQAMLAGVDSEPLRGFGLVVGLGNRGSSDCPTVIRDYLIDYMTKQVGPQGTRTGDTPVSPGRLIDSLDTAVVEVTGTVAAGSRRGERFDLQVEAIAGTSTRSLDGGLLLPVQMRFFDRSAGGQGLVAGQVLAVGDGPVFINPFVDPDSPAPEANPRRGYVLGGGRTLEEHPVRLVLLQPNYRLAQNIERRVNERFGHQPKVAEAISRGYLTLKTPPAYARYPLRFRRLAAHLFVDNRPALIERRLRELTRRAIAEEADVESIALTWEALGRSVIAHIQPFYTHENPALRFHAAQTGLRLGDLSALPAVGSIAGTAGDLRRTLAVRDLGDCRSPQAAMYLVPLLDDADQAVRIAAYEALLQRRHPAIRSKTFRHALDQMQINFILDIVESDGPALVYVRRSRLPRIAIFGSRVPVVPPVFYTGKDDSVTIHTVADSQDVRVFAKRNGRLSEQIVVPPRIVQLVEAMAAQPTMDEDTGHLRGLGLPYSRVVQIIATLCRENTIPARLVMEYAPLEDISGPDAQPERPETEAELDGPPPTDEDGSTRDETEPGAVEESS